MLRGPRAADSRYVQEGGEIRKHVARSLERMATDIIGDAATLFPFSGVTEAGTDSDTRLGRLVLQLLATAVREGVLPATLREVTALRETTEERKIEVRQLFSLVYVVERAALDALALDESFTAMSDWSGLSQIVRRGSLEVLASYVEGARGAPGLEPVVDPLTTVHTRSVIAAATEKEIHRFERFGHPFALLLVDLDRLGDINARLGYGSGDRVLERLGILVRNYFREQDWVGRFSGDAFAVLLPETHREDAAQLAERVRSTIASRIALHDHRSEEEFPLTVSVGVVCVQSIDRTVGAEQLWTEAHHAVRRAKSAGRNRVVAMDFSLPV